MTDWALELLRGMRLTGGIFLDAELTAPWCIASRVGPEDCAPFAPEPRRIIAYHYITAGKLLLKVSDQPPVTVRQGEIVVLPRNDSHILGSSLNSRPVSADSLIRPNPSGGLALIRHGGGGEKNQIICGFLGTDLSHHALLAMLPSVMKIDARDGTAGSFIESSLRFAAAELADGKASAPAMLAKLAELLFMEAVRRYLETQPPGSNAWSAGLSDPVIGRALGALHSQIQRRWTTDELAAEASLSRSAFADRFQRLIGEPPMRYLARQRLAQAAALLKETADPIARIAYQVGYESEASFNRAFRREYGEPPAAWRGKVGAAH